MQRVINAVAIERLEPPEEMLKSINARQQSRIAIAGGVAPPPSAIPSF